MITPDFHNCVFDWWHQDGIENLATRGHCIVYKINPTKADRFWQMIERPRMINTPEDAQDEIYAREKLKIEANRQRYEQDAEVQQMADKIHHDRMGAGVACDSCICLSIELLTSKKSVPKTRE